MKDTPVPASPRVRAAEEKRWRATFLAHLAATSNVAASCREADVPSARVYATRRRDPAFYRQWQEALCEGYEHLEMSLLQRLREGEIKRAAGAKIGVRVFDNATSLRLLMVHREAVSRQQAIRQHHDAGMILERLNARIDRMRAARVIAAPAASAPAEDADD